jgi:hypothetical protein
MEPVASDGEVVNLPRIVEVPHWSPCVSPTDLTGVSWFSSYELQYRSAYPRLSFSEHELVQPESLSKETNSATESGDKRTQCRFFSSPQNVPRCASCIRIWLKNIACWDTTTCSPWKDSHRFEGYCHLHLWVEGEVEHEISVKADGNQSALFHNFFIRSFSDHEDGVMYFETSVNLQ